MTNSPRPTWNLEWRKSIVWAALVVVAAYVGYQHLFSTFAAYDDEGYVMMSLRSFMDGQPLYDETFSQYGPAFYGIERGLHRVFSLPLTHDGTRLKTLATWLLVAAMCAFFVSRLNRENRVAPRGLSVLCFCLVFLHLDRLCLEPGHPQEHCALAIASCLVISLGLSDRKQRHRLLAAFGMGIIGGTVLLIKLNVGLFLMAGMAAALFLLLPASKPKTWLRWFVCFGLAALPLLVYRQHLTDIRAGALAWVTALAGVVLVCSLRKCVAATDISWRELMCLAAAAATTVVAVLAWSLANGTSTAGLLYGIVTQHVALQQNFFHPPPVSLVAVVAGLVLAIGAQYTREHFPEFAFMAAFVVVGICLLAYVRETWVPLTHGLHTRGQAGLLMSLLPGVLGLLMVGCQNNAAFAPRVVLAGVALLQPLSAFPTPGTQSAVGTFALLVVGVVLLADGRTALSNTERSSVAQAVGNRADGAFDSSPDDGGWVPWQWALLGAIVLAAIGTLGLRSAHLTRYRTGLEPLALPGAQRLRLDKGFVRQQHWLVNQLRNQADTFVFGEHGQNSLYFWSEIAPPTALNTTFWPFILNDRDQRRIIQRLNRFEKACIVRVPFDAALPEGPLAKHIECHFRPALSDDEVEIWVRKHRDVNVGVNRDSARKRELAVRASR